MKNKTIMTQHLKKYPFSCLLIAVIWVLCLIPVPETPLNDINLIDKWTHFVMYGVLTTVIWVEYIRRHGTIANWQRLLIGGMACPVVMGILVELAQAYLTTCRSGDWVDAMCNSIGVLLGAIIGKTVICIVERRKSVLSTH